MREIVKTYGEPQGKWIDYIKKNANMIKHVSCSNLEKSVCFQYCYGSHWWLGTGSPQERPLFGVDQLDDGLSSGCLAWQYSVVFNRKCSTGTEYWLVVYLPSEKYESQLGWWNSQFPIYGKIFKKCSKPPTRCSTATEYQNMIYRISEYDLPIKKSALGSHVPLKLRESLNISDSQTVAARETHRFHVCQNCQLHRFEAKNRAKARGKTW